jgi:plasmid maintenance system antidote protein VapI
MKNFLLILCLLMLMGAGLLTIAIFQRNVTPQVAILQSEIARLQSERALDAARLSAALQRTGIYVGSRLTGLAVLNLWPLWILTASATLAVANRARWTKQVLFKFESIETTIPASRAVPLIEKCVQTIELRHSGEILAYEEAISQKRLAQDIHAIRALKSIVKAEPDVEPETPVIQALPKYTLARFTASELLSDPDLQAGYLPLGRNIAEGGTLAQCEPKFATCFDMLGKQNFCKSTAAELLTLGFFRLQDAGYPVKMFLVDTHFGLPDSLATYLQPCFDRFEQRILSDKDIEAGAFVTLLESLETEVETRKATGVCEPLLVLICDEMADIFDEPENSDATYRLLKKLRRLRKAGVFQVLVHHDSTREGQGGKGTGLMNLAVSSFVVNATPTKAQRILDKNASMAVNLPKGQAVLTLPSADPVIVALPFVTPQDLTPFLRAAASAETPVAQAIDTVPTPETLTADSIRLRREFLQMKQGDLGKVIGVTQKDVSRIERGEKALTPDVRKSIFAALFAPEKSNIIPFVKRA